MKSNARIMPRDTGAISLDVVIAVMAFLASLSLGAALIAERAAVGWRTGLAGRITVQILPPDKMHAALDNQLQAALAVLRRAPGVAHAAALSEQDTVALVKPWLGSDLFVGELPLPRLIDVTLTPGARVDLVGLKRRLEIAAPDSTLDDHTRWLTRLRSLARGIIWSAYIVLGLIALATAATVSFATRAGLQAHREIVELLHRMGARSGFIARAFEWHYFLASLIAATAGAALAIVVYLAGNGLEFVGVEVVPFLPPVTLQLSEIGWLMLVPVAASWIALITARLSVFGVLSRSY
ncbi:MAG: cell division protein FtsX [Rhizomicrobium sp.]